MNIRDVNIRDPFILPHDGKYYMYGTRSATTWGKADGFDCFVSGDLHEWEGPYEIFRRPEGFFADRSFWAPECIFCGGEFYLITTFGEPDGGKGIFILKSQDPKGSFQMHSSRLTPKEWVCIDGSIFFEDAHTPVLYFSHSFEDSPTGDMCMVRLKEDLSEPAGEAVKLFEAAEAPWAKPVPFAKEEFGMAGDVYFTDGPCVTRMDDGKLYMTWSSWSDKGYAVGVAVSENGRADGPWVQRPVPIYPEDGGHGMVFRDFEGNYYFTLHNPNTKYEERPVIYRLLRDGDNLKLMEAV